MRNSHYAAQFFDDAALARMPQSRAPIERMVRVYSALKERRAINATTLARDLEVSVRSVGRDIEFMRDRLCLPIQYVPEIHSYKMEVRRER